MAESFSGRRSASTAHLASRAHTRDQRFSKMVERPAALQDLLIGLSEEVDASSPFALGRNPLSYGELRDKVARARGLLRGLGVEPGQRVAVASTSDEAVAVVYAACLASGIATVVIDPEASASEATVLIAKARPAAAFLDRAMIERTESLARDEGPALVPVDREKGKRRTGFGLVIRSRRPGGDGAFPAVLEAQEPITSPVDVPADRTALILFTSGTTSNPKGVELTFGNLAAQVETYRRHYGYGPGSRVVNHLPLHHTDGLNQGPFLAMTCGGTWLRPEPVNLQTLGAMLDLVRDERATHLVTVPTVLAMMSRLPASYDEHLSSPDFRFVASTAGYLEEPLWRVTEARFRTMVVNSYGLTETVTEAIYCGPSEETRRIGTIGKPVDCEARIVVDGEREAGIGETGMLQLRGTNIMKGYFENPEATSAAFDGEWLITGDLATVDADGFYRIVGRAKNVIIKAGVNVYPEDVTSVLLTVDGVESAVTVGVPDPLLGEKVVSCVVLASPPRAPGVESIVEHCRAHLAPEKVPGAVLVVDELPLGPSGKVELAKVRTLAGQRLTGESAAAAGAGGTPSEKVMDIAARVFNQSAGSLSPASTADDTPGWDSLSFLELVMALEGSFGFEFTPQEVMGLRSLDDVLQIVETRT